MSKARGTVSVLIATHRRVQELTRCVAAIAGQIGGFQIQLCIVNDGGETILRDLILPRETSVELSLELIQLPSNVGQVAALNAARSAASGEYIAFCDDDDRWLPHHLQDIFRMLPQSNADFFYSDAEIVVRSSNRQTLERFPFAFRDASALLPKYNPIPPATVLMTRRLVDVVGPFDEQMSHYWDWDYWLRASQHSRLQRVPFCSVLYSVSASGQNQSAHPEKMAPALRRLVEKHRLGSLPSSNFRQMADSPLLTDVRAHTVVSWDGSSTIW